MGRENQRGFSLLLLTLCSTVMFGTLGLAIDTGRMFIVKSELQAFVDAAALAANRSLDGTQTGLQAAHTMATQGPLGATKPNKWLFDTKAVTNVTDTYAASFTGTYDSYATASLSTTNTYRFVHVTASGTLALYFLPMVPGVSLTQLLQADAIAGQKAQSGGFSNGALAPFMPDAHNPSDTKNFGLAPGQKYTLKWGNRNTTTCAGDQGFDPGTAPSAHGFVDLGQGNGNSSLRGVIVYGGFPNATSTPDHVSIGDFLSSVPGNRGSSIFTSLAERSNQDPDQSSLTWDEYKAAGTGNGRRIVITAIGDPTRVTGHGSNLSEPVVKFGSFLLDPGDTISGSSGSICGTYIGPASLSGGGSGGTDGTAVYSTLLYK